MVLKNFAAKLKCKCIPQSPHKLAQRTSQVIIVSLGGDDDTLSDNISGLPDNIASASKDSWKAVRQSMAKARSQSARSKTKKLIESNEPLRRTYTWNPSRTSCGRSIPTLSDLIRSEENNFPITRVEFMKYARAHSCEENVGFLMEFERLRTLTRRIRGRENYHELVAHMAVKVLDTFVHDSAPHTLNINFKLRTQASQYTEDHDLEKLITSLSAIAIVIEKMLEYDVWERFVQKKESSGEDI
ncbi:hypothetical protein SARC_01802 [Sphaeroforma arctica JP610]|uniref:RGS domain-containing protein n=1 Tax=Sphaeroforma arctica JP610 TaxID=667725 RepID=A0A0L0GAV1_9EUKA|nr:hypothetical protein SARC_01802 [Sphaeroforma arctica JP610]KNC86044.1 hypothetical protein SARC_01802 [Sphaeroforma arctica JP610]|eukprot:XP_014159946.1 hypothetical protein SARC_01802 [Sphaeroforma arctica JP610]